FTLIELMVVVVIISILAMIAYPSYMKTVGKSHRRAAQACLVNYAQYMERFYTANMRYDEDVAGTANTLPDTDCESDQNTGKDYDYTIVAASLTQSTYTLSAAPKPGSAQADRDAACGTLTINQAGTRGAAGSTEAAAVEKCW
ncbi:MAG TPA: type IV pilin protein, partial [Solimonas sp.]|nr:type IV pilin protein [Solimonas sp.]